MPHARKDHLDALAMGLLLACCLFWGFQQVLTKATMPELPPVFQAFVRFGMATVALLAWCFWRGIPVLARPHAWGSGLLVGLLFTAEFTCLYIGLQYTSASRLTVFLYSAPFWVALLLPRFVPGERLRSLQWAGLACAFVGVAWALADSLGGKAQAALPQGWWGDLLALGGSLFWALTTVVIRSTRVGQVAPERQLLFQVAVSTALLPGVSLALGETWPTPGQISAFGWTSLLIQGLVGAFASYLAWVWMLTRYPATKISAFVFLTPVFALLFGAGWLGEPITPGLIGALALVAVGIVLVNRKGAR